MAGQPGPSGNGPADQGSSGRQQSGQRAGQRQSGQQPPRQGHGQQPTGGRQGPGGGQPGPGGGRGGGAGQPRPFTLESVWRLLLVAAAVVAVGDLFVDLLADVVASNPVDLEGALKGELGDMLYSVGFFGAVLWAAVTRGRKDVLYKGAGIAYLGALGDQFAGAVLFPNASPSATILIWPLATVTTFLGIAVAVRLYHGLTLLPGVDIRL